MKAVELSLPQPGPPARPARRSTTLEDDASFQREMQRIGRDHDGPERAAGEAAGEAAAGLVVAQRGHAAPKAPPGFRPLSARVDGAPPPARPPSATRGGASLRASSTVRVPFTAGARDPERAALDERGPPSAPFDLGPRTIPLLEPKVSSTLPPAEGLRASSRIEETLQQVMRSLRAVGLSGRTGPLAEGEGRSLEGLEQRLVQTAQLGRELHDAMTTQLSHHASAATAALDDPWRTDLLAADVAVVAGPEALHIAEENAAPAPAAGPADVVTPAPTDTLLTQPHVAAAPVERVTAAPVPSPSDFLLERVLDALDARVQLSAEEARVSVDIEGHGEVELTLRLQGHALSVAVQGAGSAALEARALELRAALAAQGIQLDHLEFRGGDTGSEPFAGGDTSSGGRDDTGSHERRHSAHDESAQDVELSSTRRSPRRGVHVKA